MTRRWRRAPAVSRASAGLLLAAVAGACATSGGGEGDAPAPDAQPRPQRPAIDFPVNRGTPVVGKQRPDLTTPPPRLDVEAQASDTPEKVTLERPDTGPARQTVGLLLPLTGDHAGLGQTMLRAAHMALSDVASTDFELVVRDTEGTRAGAKDAARSAVDAGANLVLGPVFSGSVRGVTPVAKAARVPVLAFSNNRRVAQPGVYVMGHMPGPQVDRIVGFAARRGLTRFAALLPDNGYGEIVRDALDGATRRVGAELAGTRTFRPGATDVSAPVKGLSRYAERKEKLEKRIAKFKKRDGEAAKKTVKQLKKKDALGSAPFDAVLVPVGGKTLKAVAPMMAYYDIDPSEVQYLGTSAWNDPSLGTEPALVGGWFAAPSPEGWKRFSRRFERIFGNRPARLASLAYDATALAAVLARRAPPGERTAPSVYARERLTDPSGFAGVDGLFRLTESGFVERRYAVMEMRRNDLKVLDPAPESFRAVTN